MAQELGFHEIEVTQKARIRKGVAWVFKAKRKDELTVLQQVVDWDGEGQLGDVEVIKEATRRANKSFLSLKQERVVDFSLQSLSRPPRQHKQRSAITPNAATGKPKLQDSGHTLKRTNEDRDDISDTPMGDTAWMPTGRVIPNPADGNCLWHALADQASTPDKKRSHRQMRAWTVSLMKSQPHLEDTWIAQLRPDSRGRPSHMTWEEYLKEQSTVGMWSGALEAAVCCEALNLRLWICTDTGHLHLLNKEGSDGFVCLKHHQAGHYELYQDVQENELQERLQVRKEQGARPEDTKLRGGVARLSDFASSKQSRISRATSSSNQKRCPKPVLKQQRPALSDFASSKPQPARGSGRRSPKELSEFQTISGLEPLPDDASQDAGSDHGDEEPGAHREYPALKAYYQRGSSFPEGGTKWECALCPYVARHKKSVSHMRRHHMRTCHPAATCETKNRSAHARLVFTKKAKEAVAWKCPLCPAHLTQSDSTKLAGGTISRLKQKHKETTHPEVAQKKWISLLRTQTVKSPAFRHKIRISGLNLNAHRKVTGPAGFEHFTMPKVFQSKGTAAGRKPGLNFGMSSAARCAACLAIVRTVPNQRKHKCIKEGRKRDGPREKSLATLKRAKTEWLKQPQGLDISTVRRIFHIAERAVKGLPLQQ